MEIKRLSEDFFLRDVLVVAPEILGKKLVMQKDHEKMYYTISEVEAYRGDGDMACHASKGKTRRTEVMFRKGGVLYVYLIYGIHWMLNIVTGPGDSAQAILIRGLKEVSGPGRLSTLLGIDKSFYGESLSLSKRIWIEEGEKPELIKTSPRIGIQYAGEPWISKPWRFFY